MLNERGFTLIEIVVAMGLLGVIAISFIPLMTAQYVNINKTGDKSKVTYEALKDTEEKINVEENSPTSIVADDTIHIDWEGKPTIPADVKIVTGEASTEGTITTDSKATGTAKDSKTEIKAGVPVK